MQNSSRSSLYEEITLSRNGTNVALEGRTLRFSYYESLLSPHITANLTYVDTGNGIQADGTDTQERFGTILRSLPIEGNGKEEIKFKITTQLGSLDFTTYPLKVRGTVPIGQESFREFVMLQMVSNAAIQNETTQIYERYYNNIGNTVSTMLTQKLEIPATKIILDQTQNSVSYKGSNKRPFDCIIELAKQAKPLQGSAGFLIWENKNGFNFKSIDNLSSAQPVATYKYYGAAKTTLTDEQQNYRILDIPTYTQNQDILKALKAGIYQTKNVAWDPYTGKYQELFVKLQNSGIQPMGNTPNYSSVFDQSDNFSKTNYFILDSGNSEAGISTAVNNNPLEHYAKAAMRYNLFLTQILDITVPCNPNLKAGDIIQCEFEKVTVSNKNEGAVDEQQSGKYIVLHLCHYFTPKRSFTSLRLTRDTYGLYTSGGL